MCGIAGIHFLDGFTISKQKTEALIDCLLLGIEERGRHATGIATMNNESEVWIEKGDIKASDFIMWRRDIPKFSHTTLLHTRYATQGSPKRLENNHPVEYNSTTIIHNGHINNDSDLFKGEGLERKAEVDSEIIAALIHKYGMEKSNVALSKLDGGYAIAAMDQRNPKTLVLAKGNSSPLEVANINGMVVWASTFKALKDALQAALDYNLTYTESKTLYAGDMYYIEDGKIETYKFKPLEKKYTPSYYHGDYHYDGRHSKNVWNGNKNATYKSPVTTVETEKDEEMTENCFLCNSLESVGDMWPLNGIWFCAECFEDDDDVFVKRLENKINKNDDQEIIDAEGLEFLNEEHWVVCELIGEKFGIKKEDVDKILFDDDLMDSSDVNSAEVSLYMELSEEYDKLYDELIGNFSFLDNSGDKEDKKVYISEGGHLVPYRGFVTL